MLTPQFSDLARQGKKDSKKFEASLVSVLENSEGDPDFESIILVTIQHSLYYNNLPYLKILHKYSLLQENLYIVSTKNPITKAFVYNSSFVIEGFVSNWLFKNCPIPSAFKAHMLTHFISTIYGTVNRFSNGQLIQLLDLGLIDIFSSRMDVFKQKNFSIIHDMKRYTPFIEEMLKVDIDLAEEFIKLDKFDYLLPSSVKDVFLF